MEIDEILAKFSEVAEQAQTLTFVTRDQGLQSEAVDAIDGFLHVLANEKESRVAKGNEDHANLILGLQFACQSLRSELSMYLALKNDRPEDAWNHLVDAQVELGASLRAHESLRHVRNNLRKLLAIEKLMFPPQTFMSIGSVVHRERCSICQEEYSQCDHIVGRPYMGELCSIICEDIELREISLVEEPADKRARVVYFSDKGKKRNKMTWRLE